MTLRQEPARPFDCLWCGERYEPRSPDDLEEWAKLCPACLERAGENPFIRFRLRDALEARARAETKEQGPGIGPTRESA